MMRPAAAPTVAPPRDWRRLAPGPRLAALALAGWTLLAAVLAGADLAGGADADGGPEPAQAAPVPGTAAPSLAPILDRPLFSPSRRPEAAAPLAPLAAPPPPAPPRHDRQITLKGVFIDGPEAKAFVTSSDRPEGAWVSRGGTVNGWRVAAVLAGEIRLEADGEAFSASMTAAAGHR